jgi:hypothetical protein
LEQEKQSVNYSKCFRFIRRIKLHKKIGFNNENRTIDEVKSASVILKTQKAN